VCAQAAGSYENFETDKHLFCVCAHTPNPKPQTLNCYLA